MKVYSFEAEELVDGTWKPYKGDIKLEVHIFELEQRKLMKNFGNGSYEAEFLLNRPKVIWRIKPRVLEEGFNRVDFEDVIKIQSDPIRIEWYRIAILLIFIAFLPFLALRNK